MLRKITAIVIILLGVLVIVLGLCFQSTTGSSSVNSYLMYSGGSSDMNLLSLAFTPLTDALVKACRLITAAIGIGILALGLCKLAEAFSAPAPHRPAEPPEKPLAPEYPAPAPDNRRPVMQTYDDSLPDL